MDGINKGQIKVVFQVCFGDKDELSLGYELAVFRDLLTGNQLAAFQEQGVVTSFKSWRENTKDEHTKVSLVFSN